MRVVFSTDDDGRAGIHAVFVALQDDVPARRKAAAAKVVRQSFRKKKAKKDAWVRRLVTGRQAATAGA